MGHPQSPPPKKKMTLPQIFYYILLQLQQNMAMAAPEIKQKVGKVTASGLAVKLLLTIFRQNSLHMT